MAKLDALAGVRTFSARYRAFASMRDFPAWQPAFARMGVRVDSDTVTLLERAEDRDLRAQIMAGH